MNARHIAIAVALGALACGGRPPPHSRPIALSVAALDGGELDLASLRGQVVVVHVFATGALAAQGDVPQLNAADGRDDVAVIGIAIDRETYPVIAGWRGGSKAVYQIAVADEAMRNGQSALGLITEIPTTFVLTRAGAIASRVERPLREGELAQLIEKSRAANTR